MKIKEYNRKYYLKHRGLNVFRSSQSLFQLNSGSRFILGFKLGMLSLVPVFCGCYRCGCFLNKTLSKSDKNKLLTKIRGLS